MLRPSLFKLEAGENVVEIIRHHWFVIAKAVVIYGLMTLVPLAVGIGLAGIPSLRSAFLEPFPFAILVLGGSIYALFVLLFFFHEWMDMYLDIWIVTNHRIIDIQQQGIFSRIVAQYRLARIQDMSAEVHGVLHSVLEFGDVRVQTAGAEANFVMEAVPEPYRLIQRLNTLIQECRSHERENGGGA